MVGFRIGLLVIFILFCFERSNAQRFQEPMTASEVEAEKCGPYSIGISTYVIPDPDSIVLYRIKKSTEYIRINSGGQILSGTVVTTYNRRGFILSSKEVDNNSDGKRIFQTTYSYSSSFTSVLIISKINDSITNMDSVYFEAHDKPVRWINLIRGSVSNYSYLGNSNKLISVITIDTAGNKWSKVVQYNTEGKMLSCIEIENNKTGKTDTLYAALIERDTFGRITAHRLYSRHEFMYDVNNPDSVFFPRLGDYYEYNEAGQVIKKISTGATYPHSLSYAYTYDGEGRLSTELLQLNDSTWTKRVHSYTNKIDTILSFVVYSNFFGRGPATVLHDRDVVVNNENGKWISWSRYCLIPGLQGVIEEQFRKFDQHGRLVESRTYSYNYETKELRPWNTLRISYYKNGLEKSYVLLRENDMLNTSTEWKFKYY